MRKLRYAGQTKVTAVVMSILMTLFFMLSMAPASLAVGNGGGPNQDPPCPRGTTSVKLDDVDQITEDLNVWIPVDNASGIEVRFTVGSDGEYYRFDWRSTKDNVYVRQVYIKAGNDNPFANLIMYIPWEQRDFNIGPIGQHAISHITFCYVAMEEPDEPNIDFEITKSAENLSVPIGGTINYTIRLENKGDAVEGVDVVDEMLGFEALNIDLAVDEVVYFDYEDDDELSATMGDECITNVVYASYSNASDSSKCSDRCPPQPTPIEVVRWDSVTVCPEEPTCPEIDFEVTKTVNDNDVLVGDTVYFTIRLENKGDAVEGINVVDPMLDFEMLDVDLSVGEVVYYEDYDSLAYVMDEAGCVTNVVYATYGYIYGEQQAERCPAGDCPSVGMITEWDSVRACATEDIPCPDIDFEVTKTVDRDSVSVGDTVYFTIRLENIGDAVEGINVVDPMLGFSELGIDLAVDEVVYFEAPDYNLDWTFEEEGCVTNVVYATYGYIYGAQPSMRVQSGEQCPSMEMITEWDSVRACATEDIPCPEIDFEVTKTVDRDSVSVGDTVYFTIRLENMGDAVEGINVVDPMLGFSELGIDLAVDEVVYFEAPDYNLDWTFEEEDCVTNVVYATYGYVYGLTPSDLARVVDDNLPSDCPSIGEITRWDSVTACASDDPPEDEYDLDIDKSVDDSSIYRGQDVTYTITVTNTGDYTLYDLLVVDEILDEEFIIDMLEPGAVWSVDIDSSPRSSVTNTAYVRDDEMELYDEDDAYVRVRTRDNDPDPDPDPDPEPVPDPDPVPELVPDPEPVPEAVPEAPYEPAALPYTGVTGDMIGGMGVLMLAGAALIKKKF